MDTEVIQRVWAKTWLLFHGIIPSLSYVSVSAWVPFLHISIKSYPRLSCKSLRYITEILSFLHQMLLSFTTCLLPAEFKINSLAWFHSPLRSKPCLLLHTSTYPTEAHTLFNCFLASKFLHASGHNVPLYSLRHWLYLDILFILKVQQIIT